MEGKPMTTNYERIKNMTVEEMAEFFANHILCDDCPISTICNKEMITIDECPKVFEEWLKSESE